MVKKKDKAQFPGLRKDGNLFKKKSCRGAIDNLWECTPKKAELKEEVNEKC